MLILKILVFVFGLRLFGLMFETLRAIIRDYHLERRIRAFYVMTFVSLIVAFAFGMWKWFCVK